jgi:hypothetical protein
MPVNQPDIFNARTLPFGIAWPEWPLLRFLSFNGRFSTSQAYDVPNPLQISQSGQ